MSYTGLQEVHYESSGGAGGAVVGIIYLIVILLVVASVWKIFSKAGEPGWAAIVPIYNILVMLKIAGKPAWWIILYLIPVVNFIIGILVAVEIAKAFGKGAGFGVGMALLPVIFYPMLGFGSATYQGVPAQAR